MALGQINGSQPRSGSKVFGFVGGAGTTAAAWADGVGV